MDDRLILTIDQSTAATKAMIIDCTGKILAREDIAHKQYYPQFGWVEHDPMEIYRNTITAIKGVIKYISNLSDIAVISISNQRETVVVWDKNTGEPVYNAIVWQCQRAKQLCEELINEGYSEIVHQKTGMVLSPYFSASKIKWILDNVEGVKERALEGELLAGTIDTWLIWNLTKGESHVTDHTNACRTQLFNIQTLEWDQDLLDIFKLPSSMFATIKPSNDIFGKTTAEGTFYNDIPISGIMGDSNGALFAQNCFKKGLLKVTYGTGSSVMMNTGEQLVYSSYGLLTSVAWCLDGKVNYVLDGNIANTGGTIKWLVNNLQLISSSKEVSELSLSVSDNGGVYFVPALSGLGAPHWKSDVSALIKGLSFSTYKAHIARAANESIAYQIEDVLSVMQKETSMEIKEIRVDGGATADKFLMQFQADISDAKIVSSKAEELSALGTAYMAGLAVGIWNDLNDIQNLYMQGNVYESSMKEEERNKLLHGWNEAVAQVVE